MTTHAGYLNRFILLPFPDLAEGCSVLIRNPRLMAPHELESADAAVEGETPDKDAERAAMHKTIAKLIVAWRNVYAADLNADGLDLNGEEDLEALMESLNSTDQEPLGAVNQESVSRLPFVIINKIADRMGDVADPQ